MRILYVLTRSDVMGGASVHLLDIAYGAQLLGHEVAIFVGGTGVFLNKAHDKGILCLSLNHLVREINPSKDFRSYFELKKAIESHRPDLIHAHSSKAGALCRLVGKSLGIPVVFTAHGWAFTEGVSSVRRVFYTWIERWLARHSAKIIAVSDYDKSLALTYGVGNEELISTIHNGVPGLSGDYRCSSACESNGTLRLIMVARFDVPKDHVTLLRTLSDLKDLNWSLELVGDGPLIDNVKVLASELGLEGRIVFMGACNDVATRLAKADVFVLISNWEGLPLTILEAMRAGLPVIASRVGGVSEAVAEGATGFLIDRNDTKKLAESLALLIKSHDLRQKMGEQGRRTFEQAFTFEGMLEKTLGVYEQVLREFP